MTDAELMLKAVLAEPEEDLPRLVYADVIETEEPERAEFIRVQCRIAEWDCTFKQTRDQPGWKHNCDTDDNGYWLCQPLRSRERELLTMANVERWLYPLPPSFEVDWADRFGWQPPKKAGDQNGGYVGYRVSEATIEFDLGFVNSYTFRRGFVEAVTCSWEGWTKHEAALLPTAPLRDIRFTDMPMSIEYATIVGDKYTTSRYPWITFHLPSSACDEGGFTLSNLPTGMRMVGCHISS